MCISLHSSSNIHRTNLQGATDLSMDSPKQARMKRKQNEASSARVLPQPDGEHIYSIAQKSRSAYFCNRATKPSNCAVPALENESAARSAEKLHTRDITPAPESSRIRRDACLQFLDGLLSHKHGWVFEDPVDPVLLKIPDYFDVIHQPMDLGTIETSLKEGKYNTLEDLKIDILLTFDNALEYNQEGSEVHLMAQEMKQKFLSDLGKIDFVL
jgi:hypothetical protein